MTSSNPIVRRTVVLLERAGKKQKAPIWKAASELLGGTASSQVEVNVGRISRVTEDGDVVMIPGKVLGSGKMERKATVGAFSFSTSARQKIVAKGGSAISIEQMVKDNPKGSGVKLVK